MALSWLAPSSHALAQERLDTRYRGWLDLVAYSGDLYSEDDVFLNHVSQVMSLTPVLRAELELGASRGIAPALRGGASSGIAPALRGGASLQIGLDLPFAFGGVSTWAALLEPINPQPSDGTSSGDSNDVARLGNVTWHADYLLEAAPWRVAAGFAFAISTTAARNANDGGRDAGYASAVAGSEARGLWNAWWYAAGAWGLVLPASVELDTDDYELGAETALAWLIRRGKHRDNEGIFQLGGHAAALLLPFALGVRVTGVQALDRRVIGEQRFQLSVEGYAELRVPLAWFGLGVNIPLDKPLGWLEAGDELWALRLSGGASY